MRKRRTSILIGNKHGAELGANPGESRPLRLYPTWWYLVSNGLRGFAPLPGGSTRPEASSRRRRGSPLRRRPVDCKRIASVAMGRVSDGRTCWGLTGRRGGRGPARPARPVHPSSSAREDATAVRWKGEGATACVAPSRPDIDRGLQPTPATRGLAAARRAVAPPGGRCRRHVAALAPSRPSPLRLLTPRPSHQAPVGWAL